MNVFGFVLDDTSIWLLGSAGAAALLWAGAYLNSIISRRHAARDAYKSAFDDVLLNLRENPNCPLAQIASGCNPKIAAAIDKRRGEVMFWRRKRFERDVARYKTSYRQATQYGSTLAIVMSEENDFAQKNREQFLKAIKKLMSYA